jgi:hypothetical protein
VIIVNVVLVIALLFVGSQWVKPQSLKTHAQLAFSGV